MILEPVVSVIALMFLAMGLATLVKPGLLGITFGAEVSLPPWRNEIRAVYGGFGVATAALLFLVQSSFPEFQSGVYLAVAVALFGMALGRVIGFAVERVKGWPVFYFGIEVLGGGLLLLAI